LSPSKTTKVPINLRRRLRFWRAICSSRSAPSFADAASSGQVLATGTVLAARAAGGSGARTASLTGALASGAGAGTPAPAWLWIPSGEL
jgi:hypothetical protein